MLWEIMQPQLSITVATLRIAVGFLGEREQFGWWQSSFFSEWSKAFLAPVFARTQLVAQYTGAVQAATLVHDDRIGVGRVYHLFRLPEAFEQELRQVIARPDFAHEIGVHIADHDQALGLLQSRAAKFDTETIGPVLVGQVQDMYEVDIWRAVAAHYANGFKQNSQVFPYFLNSK